MSGQSGISFLFFFLDYVHNFPLSSLSPHSHLQPIFPEAPALQHSAVLPGSHHRPGRRRPLLFLDVETSQTGLPGCPRPHTCKSTRKMKTFIPSLQCISRGPISQTVRLWVSSFSQVAVDAVRLFVCLAVQANVKSSVPFLTVSANRLKISG